MTQKLSVLIRSSLFPVVFFVGSVAVGAIDANSKDLTVRFGVSVPTLEFATKHRELPGKSLAIKPNAPSKTFLSLSYDWYGLTVASINPVSSEKEQKYGESQALDYQFRFYFKKFAAELFYQKYKGYYIDNTDEVAPGWSTNGNKRLYPDLTTEHRGLSLTYVFNPENYSMASAFDQSVRQTSSGGSWLANFSFSQHLFNNPDPLIPTELAGSYGEFEKVSAGNLSSLSLGAGGAYNLVLFENYFLSGLLMINLGPQFMKYIKTDGTTSENSFGSQAHLKVGLGYNGPKFISGFSFAGDTATYTIEKTELTFQTFELGIFVGTRF